MTAAPTGRASTRHCRPEGALSNSQIAETRGTPLMPIVHVRDEESFENALRRFKRKCEKAGVLTELKKRQHFEKPSVKRKRKALQGRKKMLRKLAEERRLGLI